MDKEKIKKATKCAFCHKAPFADGTEIQLVSITESGKILTPYDGKDSSTSVLLPMCGYHMVLSMERMMAITTQDNKIITVGKLLEFERLTDGSLNVRSKLSRSPILRKESEVAKIILGARKMQRGIESEQNKTRNRKEKDIAPAETHKS